MCEDDVENADETHLVIDFGKSGRRVSPVR